MKHQDLGRVEGPVLLFGGPYSNLQALHALMDAARQRAIPAERMICTGDVVAYCGDPSATTDALRAARIPLAAGNCEKHLAAGAPDCGCGFDAGTTCDLLSAGWYGVANAQIGPDQRGWMATAADIISFSHAGQRFAVIHGGMTDIARFIWPCSDRKVFEEEWAAVEAAIGPVDAIVAGHSGIPFTKDCAKGRWINAGVIGMPPHDGGQDTRFAVLDQGQVTFHKLGYDVEAAVAAMERAGLTQGYHSALRSGYWPSEDVLPPELRRAALASG
nr:metallophosphoesterase family protein [uncultured Sulfitobacter sp.]